MCSHLRGINTQSLSLNFNEANCKFIWIIISSKKKIYKTQRTFTKPALGHCYPIALLPQR